MQIQKVNNNSYYNNYTFAKKSPANKQYAKEKDYEILKDNIGWAFLMMGSGYACGDIIAGINNNKNVKQSNPIADKILYATVAVMILITLFQSIKAIRHYIQDKKNGVI